MQTIEVMIAEDEQSIRMGIKKMVEDFFASQKEINCVITEAKDGRDAFRKCISSEPDILITDIKMPGISGTSLIERLAQDNICPNILVISGYDDYKYVRKAMKTGVYDYLLKPIKKTQLWEALDHFMKNLVPAHLKKRSTIYMEQLAIERLFMEESHAQGIYSNFFEEQNLNEDMPCMVFFINNDQADGFKLYYEVRQFCESFTDLYPIQGEHNFWIVLCVFREPVDVNFVQSFEKHLDFAGYPVIERHSLPSLSEIYAFNARLRESFYNKAVDDQTELPVSEAAIKQVAELVLQGADAKHLHESVEKLFDRYQLDRTPKEQIRNDIMGLVYHLMAHNADMIEFVMNARFSSYDVSENLRHSSTLLELRDVVNEGLAHLSEQIRERRLASEDNIINKAIKYMEEHFSTDIQLSNVADAVFLHPNYLSNLFSMKMKITFRDYLRKIRIDHAKRLLQEQGLSINEIAEQSGFKDVTHFFRVFKAITGVTPKKYKQINS